MRRLVLTHFSQRYPDPAPFHDEAAAVFAGEIVVAQDLMRVAVPGTQARLTPSAGRDATGLLRRRRWVRTG